MAPFLDALRTLPVWAAALLALAENALLVGVGVGCGHLVLRSGGASGAGAGPGARVGSDGPVVRGENQTDHLQRVLAGAAVLGNAAVTLLGWYLWKQGLIHLDPHLSWGTLVDLLLLILIMDAVMYAGHALAHLRRLFPLAHQLHHRFTDARPMTLFALHPAEVLGFGAVWIGVLAVYTFDAWAVAAYTVVNLIFGVLGHLGLDPTPPRIRRSAVFYLVATPALHDGHHRDPRYNLGFYTTIGDRLFGTLAPDYDRERTGT
ncbi:sterol desaturase family protein [Longispora sp. NPDC051575]|uniref:sterol desaturase family protein n=1 Tax=Longispora sp. NPDC051575 TaxID=3154943 RepID=UPI003417837E